VVEVIIKSFEGFEEADFDAFRPEKWISNLFNRERMLITQKLSALGSGLKEGLGPELAELEPGTSDDRPCFRNQNRVDHQLLFFLRTAEQRRRVGPIIDRKRPMVLMTSDPAVHQQHLHLGIRIDLSGIQVGLFLHGHAHLDKENLVARLGREEELSAFSGLVRRLGSGWSCLEAGGSEAPCMQVEPALLHAQIEALHDPASSWAVRWSLVREEQSTMGPALRDTVQGLLQQLLSLYFFVAWSSSNDQIRLEEQLRQEAVGKAEAEARAREEADRLAEERQRRQEEARARSEEAEWDRRILTSRLRRPLPRSDGSVGGEGERAGEEPPAGASASPAATTSIPAAPGGPPGGREPREGEPGGSSLVAIQPHPERGAPGSPAGPREARDPGQGHRTRHGREHEGPAHHGPPRHGPSRARLGSDERGRPAASPGGSPPRGGHPRAEREQRSPGERGDQVAGSPPYRHKPQPSGQGGLAAERGRDERAPGAGRDGEPSRWSDGRARPGQAAGEAARRERGRAAGAAERAEHRPPAVMLEIGETVRFERGLMAGKEGQIEAIDAEGMMTVAIRGLKVRVSPREVKKV